MTTESKEIIGRMSCPLCGETMQDVKINKNNNLYVYCDNRCKFTLNPKMSRLALIELRAGRCFKKGNVFILPLNAAAKKPDNYFFEEEEEDF